MSAHANPTNNLELPPLTASEEIRDICRESELTPGEVHAEFLNLNGQITAHLDAFVGKIAAFGLVCCGARAMTVDGEVPIPPCVANMLL